MHLSRHEKNLIRPTRAEVDLKAILSNYREIKRLAGKNTQILAVVKGDAYGHGMMEVAGLLNRIGVNFFGVSDIAEGIELRDHGIKKNILLFESTLPSDSQKIIKYNLTPTICTLELASSLDYYAGLAHKRVDIHVDVDTGMGRMGVWHKDAQEFIARLMQFKNLSIKGIYTHFPVADSDRRFTENQVKNLYHLVTSLDQKGLVVPYIHAANSMGICSYKTRILNLARPGLMLYGLYPSQRLKPKVRLTPALSVKSKIVFLKKLAKGRSISYGRTFIAPKDIMIATLAIGYRDGYFRCLSNKSHVIIHGRRAPVVGRVTMDQIMVDVSKIKSVKLGMDAIILGRQGNAEVSADELAHLAGTINYEIVCNLGNRVEREYKN